MPAPVPTMKRQLTEYIKENYGDDYQLPELTREQLIEWYGLAKKGEELPFDIVAERVESDVKKEEPKVEQKEESPVNSASKDIDPDLKAQIEKLRQRGRKQE